jgi:hypothetical protein
MLVDSQDAQIVGDGPRILMAWLQVVGDSEMLNGVDDSYWDEMASGANCDV